MSGAQAFDQSSGQLEVAVNGADQHVARRIAAELVRQGIHVASTADICLLVDAPPGYALVGVPQLVTQHRLVIVTTTNTCPEYVADIWDAKPMAMLAGVDTSTHIVDVIAAVRKGERFRLASGESTRLTSAQRRVLQLVARGRTNGQIAQTLRIQPQTAANVLTSLFAELKVSNRHELILCYFNVYRPLWSMDDWT